MNKLISILLIMMVFCGFNAIAYPPVTLSTIIKSNDFWYVKSTFYVNVLDVGGTSGTNGVIIYNGTPIASLPTGTPVYVESDPIWSATAGSVVYSNQLGSNAIWSASEQKWNFSGGGVAEIDPIWSSEKSSYATGTPLYTFSETDPIWSSTSNIYIRKAYNTTNAATTVSYNFLAAPLTNGLGVVIDDGNWIWQLGLGWNQAYSNSEGKILAVTNVLQTTGVVYTVNTVLSRPSSVSTVVYIVVGTYTNLVGVYSVITNTIIYTNNNINSTDIKYVITNRYPSSSWRLYSVSITKSAITNIFGSEEVDPTSTGKVSKTGDVITGPVTNFEPVYISGPSGDFGKLYLWEGAVGEYSSFETTDGGFKFTAANPVDGIDFGSSVLYNIGEPTGAGDVGNRGYNDARYVSTNVVTNFVSKTGDTMTGPLTMGTTNGITLGGVSRTNWPEASGVGGDLEGLSNSVLGAWATGSNGLTIANAASPTNTRPANWPAWANANTVTLYTATHYGLNLTNTAGLWAILPNAGTNYKHSVMVTLFNTNTFAVPGCSLTGLTLRTDSISALFYKPVGATGYYPAVQVFP